MVRELAGGWVLVWFWSEQSEDEDPALLDGDGVDDQAGAVAVRGDPLVAGRVEGVSSGP